MQDFRALVSVYLCKRTIQTVENGENLNVIALICCKKRCEEEKLNVIINFADTCLECEKKMLPEDRSTARGENLIEI